MYLNCHSYFSFKYGALSIKDLLQHAQENGVSSLALTDINNTSGCLDFIRTSAAFGIKPVVGIDFRNGINQCFVGIARNNEGFYELNRFLSKCLLAEAVPKRAPFFDYSYIIYPYGSIEPQVLKENEYIGIKQTDLARFLFTGWKTHSHKYVLLHTATFRNKRDFNAHRLLRAIHHNTLLSKLPVSEQANESDLLLPEAELLKIYENYPRIIRNTVHILNDCSISFEFGTSKNKKLFNDSEQADIEQLRKLAYEGLYYRYNNPDDATLQRLEKELKLITDMGFTSYFLINWDIVSYAQQRNFFYVGRGSGANSIVAYCLKITDVDPIGLDLYFERFMNQFRVNPPDFDIDFSWKDRDEMIDYIFKTYGKEHTCLLATYSTFQSRAVMRELGKVFGLPKAEIDSLIEYRKRPEELDQVGKLIYKYSEYIHDFPGHLSIHAGGILISEKPIHYYTATSLPPKGFPLSQFSMLEAEDVGLYKFDILSQRGLGHIKEAVEIVKKNKGVEIDIHDVKAFKEDIKIKENLRQAKTMGCFYVESPAMRMLLKKLEADTYPALVAASSIIRPGVAQSGMMHEYIVCFRDPSKAKYIHPMLKELMQETFGIMVYQEDVIKVAHHFAGLSLAEADVLRRGMSGKFRGREEFDKAKDKFIKGCLKKGYKDEVTTEVWRQVESFAGYSFSKGHSASYAVESYQSMFLKAYYPLEFMVGVINNFGGFYKTEFYIHEARMCGANIQAPCINKSENLTCIYEKDIYLGFIHMGEMEEKTALRIISERALNGPYKSLNDLITRISISIEQLRLLIRIGAFRFTGKTKKELLWEMYALLGHSKRSKPGTELFEVEQKEFRLPELHYNILDDAMDEIEILGFSLCSPFLLLEKKTDERLKASDLLNHVRKIISADGYLVCTKVTRTKKGDEMCFGTFLDRDGAFLDTVHFPDVLNNFPFRGKGCYNITGKVTEEFGFPTIEVIRLEKLHVITNSNKLNIY
jgi:DNA-directed DNA polymerase III PolC